MLALDAGWVIWHWLIFVLVNGLMACAAFFTARLWAKGCLTRVEVVMLALVLMIGQIVVSQIVLGLLGWLSWWPVMALNALIAVALLWWLARRPHLPLRAEFFDWRHDAVALGMLLIVGAILAVFFLNSLSASPYGADSLTYHLPRSVDWLQTGSLQDEARLPYFYYPNTSELFTVWLMLPFHEAVLANWLNWPFAILAALAIFSLARRLGLSPRWSIYSSLFFFSIRTVEVVLGYVSFQDNDVLLAGGFLAAAALALAAMESHNRWLLVGEGIALGLVIGTKFSGLGYAALIIVAQVMLALAHRRGKRLIVDLALLTSSLLAVGGYWYLRNWLEWQNPIPPNAIKLAGLVLFPGRDAPVLFQTSSLLSALLNGKDLSTVLQLFWDRSVLGQGGFIVLLTLPLLAVFTLAWLVRLFQRRPWSTLKSIVYVVLPWGTLVLLLLTPFAVTSGASPFDQLEFGYSPTRYGLGLWALGGLLVARLFSEWGRRWNSWLPDGLAALFIVHSWVTLLYYQRQFTVPALSQQSVVDWVWLLLALIAVDRVWRWQRPLRVRILLAGLCLAITSVLIVQPKYSANITARQALYDIAFPNTTIVRQQIALAGAQVISPVGFSDLFTLYDPGLNTRLILCSGLAQPWMECLHTHGVELVLFLETPQGSVGKPDEATVVEAYPNQLSLLYSDNNLHIYRVMP